MLNVKMIDVERSRNISVNVYMAGSMYVGRV